MSYRQLINDVNKIKTGKYVTRLETEKFYQKNQFENPVRKLLERVFHYDYSFFWGVRWMPIEVEQDDTEKS